MQQNIRLAYFIALLSCVFVLISVILFYFVPTANKSIFTEVNVLGAMMPKLWLFITYLGDGRFIGCVLIIFFWRKKHLLLVSILSGISVHFIVQSAKRIFGVLRPEHNIDGLEVFVLGPSLNITDYAFPSGHSAASAMCACLLILNIQSIAVKYILAITMMLVALSRVAIGAHWPADIFAGLFLGCIIAIFWSYFSHYFTSIIIAHISYIICFALSLRVIFSASSMHTLLPFLSYLDFILGTVAAALCLLAYGKYTLGLGSKFKLSMKSNID